MISGFLRKSPVIALAFFAACSKDTSGPSRVPTTVAFSTTAPQSAVAGSTVTPGLTFSVKDQNGSPIAGVPVTITVSGGGTLTGAPTSTSAGETSIGTLVLGTIVGVNTVTIKAGDLAPITFSITTVAGPPSQVLVTSGGNQSAVAGSTLAPITLKLADQFGNGVASRPLTVSVAEGGGAVTPTSGTTDASGQVSGIIWTLGKSAVSQKLTAISTGIAVSVPATVATSYSLEVRYFGVDIAPDIKSAFDNAAARLRGVIVGTLGPVTANNIPLGDPASPNTNCGVTGVVLNETVRDVIIYAQVKPIDGPGKILGSAGPCLVRNTSRLTIVGVMQFDSEDLAALASSGRLEPVILHEMSHVVGFGTLWDEKKPSLIVGAGGVDPRFVGPLAQAECVAEGGTTLCIGGVAVENCVSISNCGTGTRDSHWREGNGVLPGFRTELMTGFINGGVANPYSNMTIQSLGDLGYTVNGLAADPYSVPSPSLRALFQLDSEEPAPHWESLRYPQAMVSRSGVITPMERQ